LFSIDDLQQLIDENRQQRAVAAGGARLVIDEEVARFASPNRRAHDAGPAIRALRLQAGWDPDCRPWNKHNACWPRVIRGPR